MTNLFLTLFCAALVCGAQVAEDKAQTPPEQGAHPMRFIVFGDSRPLHQGDPLPQIFKDQIAELNLLHPDMVVLTGDQIFGVWLDPEKQHAEWDAFDALWETVECPSKHKIVGNHDIYRSQDERIYIERYGADSLYYSVNAYGCHFIMLNTEDEYGADWGEKTWIRGAQFEWLKNDLEKWGHRRTFVFLHRPLWKSIENPQHWYGDVLPLLRQYNVDSIFAGHWHAFSYRKDYGIPCVVTGGAGAPSQADHEYDWGMFLHMVLVTVPADPNEKSKLAVIRSGSVLSPDKGNWIRREGYWFDLPGSPKHKVTSTLEQP